MVRARTVRCAWGSGTPAAAGAGARADGMEAAFYGSDVQHVEEHRKEAAGGDDIHNPGDHGRGDGAPARRGAGSRSEAAQAAGGPPQDAVDEALEQADRRVGGADGGGGLMPVGL